MSFLVSLATGFFNEDTEIMRSQAEFDREQAEKANLKKIELAKENRAFGRELIKKNLDASFKTQQQYLKDVAAGNIKPVKLKTESGMLTAMDMFGINQSYISQGKAPIYNVPSLYERIEKIEKFGTMIGKGINAFNYESEFQTKPNYMNAQSLLAQMSGSTGNNASELERLKSAPLAVKENLKSQLQSAEQVYKDGFHTNTIGDFDPEKTLQMYPPAELYKDGAVFGGINKIKNALGMSLGLESDIIDSVNAVKNKKIESSESGGVQKKYQTYFVANNRSYGGYNYPQGQEKGMEIVSILAPKNDFLYAGTAFLKEKDIQDLDIPTEEKIKLFNHGISIASMDGARGLDPERGLLKLSKESIIKFNNAIYDGKIIQQGDIRLAGAALMGIMEVADDDKESSVNSIYINENGSQYMSKKRFGSVPKGDKAKQDLKTRYDALDQSVKDLRDLQIQIATKGSTDAFSSLKNIIIGVFDIDKGFVGNVIDEFKSTSDLQIGGKYKDGKDAITQDYLDNLQAGLDSKRGAAAEVEALRISLAFKMARAADPSGRLSNQDIDLQLRRLGGGLFTTEDYAVKQVDKVLEDFERELQSIEVFYKYGQKNTRLTKNEARYIDGVIAANYINKKMQEFNNPASNDPSSSASVGVQDLTQDGNYKKAEGYVGVFLKGTDFYRQTGTKEDGTPIGTLIPKDQEKETLKNLMIKSQGGS